MPHPHAEKKPHVLVLPSWVGEPGTTIADGFFRDQARALQNHGAAVAYLCVGQRSLRELSARALCQTRFHRTWEPEQDVWTYRMHSWNMFQRTIAGSKVWVWLCERMVDRYIRAIGRPDVIHAHACLWAGYAALRIRSRLSIPYIITEHSSGLLTGNMRRNELPYLKQALAGADAALAVGARLGQCMCEHIPELPVRVVPNVVDTSYFVPPLERNVQPFRFTAIASLTKRKAIDVLLTAFAKAFRFDTRVVLSIVGDGPELTSLLAQARSLGIAERVDFHGELSRPDVRSALWNANAFVLPSLSEPFGVVLIEAMATGLPVIGTRSGGPEEIVTPDCGVLVPPGDVTALSGALIAVRRAKYDSDAIRRGVLDRYSEAAVAKTLLAVYEEILDREGALCAR